MFEEYLQDSYEFYQLAEQKAKNDEDREARRYYRAAVFYASGAIEAFVNYIADSFAKAGDKTISQFEIDFLNDKVMFFTIEKGIMERQEFHRLDDKVKLLIKKFVHSFDFQSNTWVKFIEFKRFRDTLVHPKVMDDEIDSKVYRNRVKDGLMAIIQIMNTISIGMYKKPLRNQLLDLIPE